MATPLPQIDVSHLKAALIAAKEKRSEATLRRADAALLTQQQNHRRAVEQVLRPFFTKAGLDIEKLDEMAAQNQSELRRIFQNHKAEAAKHASLEMAAISEGGSTTSPRFTEPGKSPGGPLYGHPFGPHFYLANACRQLQRLPYPAGQ